MSLKRVEPFWTHVTAYKLQKSVEMGNFGTNSATNHPGGMWGGGVIGKDCLGGMSLERAKRARKSFEGGIMVEVFRIVSGVTQHATLCSPVADIPSLTSSVPIFRLD